MPAPKMGRPPTAWLVDVYFEGRLIATCPIVAQPDQAVDQRESLLTAAGRMLKDDGVMDDKQLSVSLFNIRPGAG